MNAALLAAMLVTVPLRALHGSGEHGTATLTQRGADVVVNITVTHTAPESAPEFAHIHRGTCANLGAATTYELQPIRYGRSTTVLRNVDLKSFGTGSYAIAIHRTLAHVSQHIACGGPLS